MTAPRCPLELPIVKALLGPFFPSTVCRARFVRALLMPSDIGGSFRLSAMFEQQTVDESSVFFRFEKSGLSKLKPNPNREISGLGSEDCL